MQDEPCRELVYRWTSVVALSATPRPPARHVRRRANLAWCIDERVDPALPRSSSGRRTTMPKLIVNAFLTLDGVMQAPGGPDEDREGGFEHGGWQFPYTDDVTGKLVTDGLADAG